MQLRKAYRMRMNVRPLAIRPYNVRLTAHVTTQTDMIIDNDPVVTRNISVPRDMSQLSCSSFTAGIVEAVLDGLGFVSSPL
jgi:hypothetical protein